jgi:hypothetical protein
MTQANLVQVPSFFGQVVPNQHASLQRHQHKRHIEYTCTPLNFTRRDLSVADRHGLRYTLPRQSDPQYSDLIVRVEINIPDAVEINIPYLLSVSEDESTPVIKCTKSHLGGMRDLNDPYRREFRGGMFLTFDCPISLKDLEKYGGTVYYHDVDLVISTLDVDDCPAHPYSENGMAMQPITEYDARDLNLFNLSMEIVDNKGLIGDRYVIFGGSVYRIKATKNYRKRDGVHVEWNKPVETERETPGKKYRHFEIAEAEQEFELYRTHADAINRGDASANRKEELARLEHDNTLLKKQLESEKGSLEMQMVRLKSDLDQKNQTFEMLRKEREEIIQSHEHQLSIERIKYKDLMEARSVDRKDSSEVLKFVPTFLAGLATAFLALKAIM